MKIIFSIICILTFCNYLFAQSENSHCPSITILGPSEVVPPDEIMFFTATVSGEVKNYNTKYKWTVDKGKIVEGQGTTVIRVSTEGLSDTTVTASFEIEGLPKECSKVDSETGVIAPKLPWEPIDSYNKISFPDELVRIDSFLVELYRNSNYKGFIWITTDKDESFTDVKNHIKKLVKHIKHRKISPGRIIFLIEKADYRSTTIFYMNEETKLPKCEDCEIIKGSDVK